MAREWPQFPAHAPHQKVLNGLSRQETPQEDEQAQVSQAHQGESTQEESLAIPTKIPESVPTARSHRVLVQGLMVEGDAGPRCVAEKITVSLRSRSRGIADRRAATLRVVSASLRIRLVPPLWGWGIVARMFVDLLSSTTRLQHGPGLSLHRDPGGRARNLSLQGHEIGFWAGGFTPTGQPGSSP